MDRFDAMQAFARVVEAGSFTKAAQTLHMSKTTVTQLVQQLEARLRVKLLNRTTRQVKVTADGAAYYERVVRLLADLDDADTSLSSAVASPRGRLRVDVPSPLARLILMPALPAFHARYPEIQLRHGRERPHGGPDRRQRGLRAARRRNHRPVVDRAPRGRSADRRVRRTQLPAARRHAAAPG